MDSKAIVDGAKNTMDAVSKSTVGVAVASSFNALKTSLVNIGAPLVEGALKLVAPAANVAGTVRPWISGIAGGAVVLGASFLTMKALKGVKFTLQHISKKLKKKDEERGY